jgi:hypothetical protein
MVSRGGLPDNASMIRDGGSMNRSLEDSGGFKTSSAWHRQLEHTQSVEGVIETLRDYLATLSPGQLSRLPELCRSVRAKAEDDIEYWTFKLSHHGADENEEWVDVDLMREVFNHFLHASVRLVHIHKAIAGEAQPH